MMSLTKILRVSSLIKTIDTTRISIIGSTKSYSFFPDFYMKPTFKKEDQLLLKESGEAEKLSHVPILPAGNYDTCSEFYDPTIQKFINYILRKGKRQLARSLLDETFEKIKRIQVEKYHKASPNERVNVIIDPKVIFYKALENATPVMELMAIKKGGITYQVPTPILEPRQQFLAMNWLIRVSKEKDGAIPFSTVLAREIIEASNNSGRVVKKKFDLHKQCEANRAYAHYRWA